MPRHNPDSGLPPRVSAHGNGYRIRYRSPGMPKYKNSPTFVTPQECVAFEADELVKANAPTPQLLPPPPLADYLEHEWWWEYTTGEQLPVTQRAMKRRITLFFKTAAWANDPSKAAGVDRELLRAWLDTLTDDEVPSRVSNDRTRAETLEPNEQYDFAADLAAMHGQQSEYALPTRTKLQGVLWMLQSAFQSMVDHPRYDIWVNPAAGLTIKPFKQARREKAKWARIEAKQRRKVQRHHIKALSQTLDARDLLPFWLMCLGGLRISEAFGVRIKDWDGSQRMLSVLKQLDPRRTEDGIVMLRDPKTDSSIRYIIVCQAFADAINAHIAAVHGPDPDPEALLCAPHAAWGATGNFRRRLKNAAMMRELTCDRPGYVGKPLDLRPHALRKFIASYLHKRGDIPEAARSEYLGHKIKRTDEDRNGSETTMFTYTDADPDDIGRIGDAIGGLIAEMGLELQPRDASRFVTPAQAAKVLGVKIGQIYRRIDQGVLEVHRAVARPHGTPGSNKRFLALADIEAIRDQIRPPVDVAVTAADAARTLGLDVPKVLRLSNRHVNGGDELRRWDQPSSAWSTADIYITVESIAARHVVEQRIRGGDLLTAKEVCRRIGKPNVVGLDVVGIDFRYYNGRRYYELERVSELVEANWPAGHIALGKAALSLCLTVGEFLTLAGKPLRHLQPKDSFRPIPDLVVQAVRARIIADRADRAHGRATTAAATPPTSVHTQPDPTVWHLLAAWSDHFELAVPQLDRLMAEQGMARTKYRRALYGRVIDLDALSELHFPAGWLTVPQAAEALGRSIDWIRTNSSTTAGAAKLLSREIFPRQRKRVLISLQSIDAYKFSIDPTRGEMLTIAQARALCNVGGDRMRDILVRGRLPYTGSLNRAGGGRRVRIRRSDLDVFIKAETPPSDWLTIEQVLSAIHAHGRTISMTSLLRQVRQGNLPARHFALGGTRTWFAPNAADVWMGQRPDDFVSVRALLAAAGFSNPTGAIYTRARNLRSSIPGATQPLPRSPWLFPLSSALTLRQLLIDSGHVPDSDATLINAA